MVTFLPVCEAVKRYCRKRPFCLGMILILKFNSSPCRMEPRNTNPTLPAEAADALSILKHRLGTSLKAVYLHGSAVGRGLRKRSDVDLLAVIEGPLPTSVRAPLATDLMAVSGVYPLDLKGRRPLEIMLFQSADLECLTYPARAEFIYGEWLRDAFPDGASQQVEANPEFTLLLAQARQEAVTIIGPDLADLVADIPSNVIHRAIGDLLPELVASIDGDERNVLLTLARMWLTLTTDQFASKDAAADWAGPQLSDQVAATLSIARHAYLGVQEDDLHLRRTEVAQALEELSKQVLAAL